MKSIVILSAIAGLLFTTANCAPAQAKDKPAGNPQRFAAFKPRSQSSSAMHQISANKGKPVKSRDIGAGAYRKNYAEHRRTASRELGHSAFRAASPSRMRTHK
ncbi:MAG: hypothetical protein ACRD3W_09345 [Terriglobales bacterium]